MAYNFTPVQGRTYLQRGKQWQDITPANSPLPKYYETVASDIRGELPPDVVDQIKRNAAEFGLAAGVPGSEFAGYRGLRQLGLTSLDRINRAQQLLHPQVMSGIQRGYQLQDQWRAYALQQQAAQQAAMERASQRWGMRGGTPPIVGGPQSSGGPMRSEKPPSNTQSLVNSILSKYGFGGGGGPLNYSNGEPDTQTFSGGAPAYSPNIVAENTPTSDEYGTTLDLGYPYTGGFTPTPFGYQRDFQENVSPYEQSFSFPQSAGGEWYDPFSEY